MKLLIEIMPDTSRNVILEISVTGNYKYLISGDQWKW